MQREVCNSPSEGTRFSPSCQSRPEHPVVSDGNSVIADDQLANLNGDLLNLIDSTTNSLRVLV